MSAGAAVLILLLATSPAAQEKREKKAPEVRGVFRSFDDRTITVAQGENQSLVSFDKLITAEVWIDGKEAKLEELKPGMLLIMELLEGQAKVGVVRAVGPQTGGQLKSVDEASRKLTLAGRRGGEGEGEQDKSYGVADDVIVMMDGAKTSLSSLKAGQTVSLQLSADRTRVLGIRQGTNGERRGPPRPLTLDGRVSAIDPFAGTLTLVYGEDSKERRLTVLPDAKVTIEGQSSKLEDVKTDVRARVRLTDDGKAAEITIGQKKKSGDGDK